MIRKLCSALVAYFLQFSVSWPNCVKHLICCLYSGKYIPYASLGDQPDITGIIRDLSDSKATATFWFAAALVEEVGKTDSSSMKQLSTPMCMNFIAYCDSRHQFHVRVVPNAETVVSMVSRYIVTNIPTDSVKVRQEAMTCFQVHLTSIVSCMHANFEI